MVTLTPLGPLLQQHYWESLSMGLWFGRPDSFQNNHVIECVQPYESDAVLQQSMRSCLQLLK